MSKNPFQTVSTGVFDRSGADEISERAFFGTLAVVLLYGFLMTAWVASQCATTFAQGINWIELVVIGLIMPIIGIFIAVISENPFVSFFGYNLVVVPFGVILAPVLQHYSPNVIQDTFLITGLDVFIMSALGVTFPKFFSNIGGVLFTALGGLVIVRIVQCFVPSFANFTLIDWISAGVFSLYVGFDWWRANDVPKTFDNAIDLALSLYLDIFNLFLSILRILGNKS